MKTKDFAGLFFQQIAIHRTGAHHDDLLLQRFTLLRRQFILLFGGVDLAVERDKTQIGTLSGNQMVAEIEGQADPDHGDQVLAKNISLFDESLHIPNESHPSHGVKQYHERNQRLMWVH